MAGGALGAVEALLLILEKEIGAFALVANLVAEQKLFSGAGHTWEVGVGAPYEVMPQLRLGAEFWTIQETAGGVTEGSYFVGPSVSWASSKSSGCNSAPGSAWATLRAAPSSARCWALEPAARKDWPAVMMQAEKTHLSPEERAQILQYLHGPARP